MGAGIRYGLKKQRYGKNGTRAACLLAVFAAFLTAGGAVAAAAYDRELARAGIQPVEKDLAVILGNLYDNAIEAAAACEKGYVSLDIWMEHRVLEIEMVNSYTGERRPELPTTKRDAGFHGLGLRSVKGLVKQHGGRCSVELKQAENGGEVPEDAEAADQNAAAGEAAVLVELPVE